MSLVSALVEIYKKLAQNLDVCIRNHRDGVSRKWANQVVQKAEIEERLTLRVKKPIVKKEFKNIQQSRKYPYAYVSILYR